MKTPIFLTTLLLAACSAKEDEPSQVAPSALVSIAPVESAYLASTVALYGNADADAEGRTTVSTPIDAFVAHIAGPSGTAVARGAVIAVLTPGPIAKLDLARASAEARATGSALDRASRLRAEGTVGDGEVETARASAVAASATRDSLMARITALTLRAPVAGIIETVPAKPGELLTAGATVATVIDPRHLVARFGVEPALARSLRAGAFIALGTADSAARFESRILSVAPIVDPQTRMASILVALPTGHRLAAGEPLIADVDAPYVAGGGSAGVIPYAALLDDAGQPFVYVVSKGIAHRRNVLPGAVSKDRVAIEQGLRGDEQVVMRGETALADGMRVRTR